MKAAVPRPAGFRGRHELGPVDVRRVRRRATGATLSPTARPAGLVLLAHRDSDEFKFCPSGAEQPDLG